MLHKHTLYSRYSKYHKNSIYCIFQTIKRTQNLRLKKKLYKDISIIVLIFTLSPITRFVNITVRTTYLGLTYYYSLQKLSITLLISHFKWLFVTSITTFHKFFTQVHTYTWNFWSFHTSYCWNIVSKDITRSILPGLGTLLEYSNF